MGRDNFVPAEAVDVLGDVLGGPKATQDINIRRELAWDYQQLGSDAASAIEHTVAIKKSERRASEAIIEAGQHLSAMQQMLGRGQWLDWLETEFHMSQRTAYNMIEVANKFGGNVAKIATIQPSVLYMLAGDNVPEPAREAVINTAAAGVKVTVADAKAVIDSHRPSRPTPQPVPAKPVYTPVTIAGDSERRAVMNTPPADAPFFSVADGDRIVRDAAREYFTWPHTPQELAERLRTAATRKTVFWTFVADKWPARTNLDTSLYPALLSVAQEAERGEFVLNTPAAAAESEQPIPARGVYIVPESAANDGPPFITLDELEVVDSVTVTVYVAPETQAELEKCLSDDEEISHPLDCYEDDETEAARHDVGDGKPDMAAVVAEDLATLDRLKWPRKMRDLHELKMWFKATRDQKLKEYAKLTGREVPALSGAFDHMIAVLEKTMDAVEQEAVMSVAA